MKSKSNLSPVKKKNIKYLHEKRESVEQEISLCSVSDVGKIKKLLSEWTDINYVLQDIWGFKQDRNKHCSWHIPHCKCPKMDNDEYYPEMRFFTEKCVIHDLLKDIN